VTQLDGKAIHDITSSVKFNKDNTVASFSLGDQAIGKYKITFTTDAYSLSSSLTVTDKLSLKDVKYLVVAEKYSFPDSFD
jgi:hypothetical protein